MVQARQADCTSDPRHPDPFPILLVVTPEGWVQYDLESRWHGIRYLAFDGEVVWGTSLPANDQVVLDLLDEHWLLPIPNGYPQQPIAQRATWLWDGRVIQLRLNHADLTAVPLSWGN